MHNSCALKWQALYGCCYICNSNSITSPNMIVNDNLFQESDNLSIVSGETPKKGNLVFLIPKIGDNIVEMVCGNKKSTSDVVTNEQVNMFMLFIQSYNVSNVM